jgi:hypothetical protein
MLGVQQYSLLDSLGEYLELPLEEYWLEEGRYRRVARGQLAELGLA